MSRFFIVSLFWINCLAGATPAQETVQEFIRTAEPFAGLKEDNLLHSIITRPGSGEALAAFLLRDTLHIYSIRQLCPVSYCASCSYMQKILGKYPIPIRTDSAQPVLGMGYSNDGTLPIMSWMGLILAYPDRSAYRWSLSLDAGCNLLQLDTLRLPNPGQPQFVIPGPPTQKYSELVFTILGSGGTQSWVSQKGEVFSGTAGLNSGFTAFGQDWLGRNDGRICTIWYSSDGYPPTIKEVARPFHAPINLIDSSGALSDSGHFAVREGSGAWRDFAIPPADYTRFQVLLDERGLGVELYRKGSTDSSYILLENKPTLFTFDPVNLVSPSREPYQFASSDSMHIKVVLNDKERNFGSVILRFRNGENSVVLMSRLAFFSPRKICYGFCPTENPPTLNFRLDPDSASFALPVVTASYVERSGCSIGFYISKYETFGRSLAWNPGDTLELVSDGDRFVIVNAIATRIHKQAPAFKPMDKQTGEATTDALGRRGPAAPAFRPWEPTQFGLSIPLNWP